MRTRKARVQGQVNWYRTPEEGSARKGKAARTWSLFLAGPKVDSWNFWDPKTGRTVHWREFINELRDASAFQRERVKTLDELIAEVRTLPDMTPSERAIQRLDFVYGNLACSTNHKPTLEAFLTLASSMSIEVGAFNKWADAKKWWAAE